MKTLFHHVLIFDEDCPLCRAYTGAFVKTRMLASNGCEAYQQMNEISSILIDKKRARNEIALINTRTGHVIYGLDSLFAVLANSWPVLTLLFKWPVFKWLMNRLYAFISYNRKVIMPAPLRFNSCVPDLNINYRIAYIVVAWLMSSWILSTYSSLLVGIVPESGFFREILICGGQIFFQTVAIGIISPQKRLDYLGNIMTVSFAGGILLVIILIFSRISGYTNPLFYMLLFMAALSLMFAEHWRRMKLLEIHWSASLCWVVYRLMVLIFILQL